jgi:hypothetical protein
LEEKKMPQVAIVREAELAGTLAEMAANGSVMAQALLANLLTKTEKPVSSDTVICAGEALAALWVERFKTAGRDPNELVPLHPTETERLLPGDYDVSKDGANKRLQTLSPQSAASHAYRQVAYAAFGLPAHPDAARALHDAAPRDNR